jgi:predicted transcriptional regulator
VTSNTAEPTTSIASEILAYLVEHPAAQDTFEGIVEWWFLEQEIQRRTTEVKDALSSLVNKGLVIERKGRDGRLCYHINQRKMQEIHLLLSKDTKRDK